MNEKAKCKNCTDKMIEEMAKLCCWFENRKCTANPGIDDVCDMSCAYGQAFEKLISEGYRKIPKGSVVLTEKEYNELIERPLKAMGELTCDKIKEKK